MKMKHHFKLQKHFSCWIDSAYHYTRGHNFRVDVGKIPTIPPWPNNPPAPVWEDSSLQPRSDISCWIVSVYDYTKSYK